MKTLREKFIEIINNPDAGRGGDEIIDELLIAIAERDKYVIGESEDWSSFVEHYRSTLNTYDQDLLAAVKEIELTIRIKLQEEQRQRAKESLG